MLNQHPFLAALLLKKVIGLNTLWRIQTGPREISIFLEQQRKRIFL